MVFSTRRAFKMKIENIDIDNTIQQVKGLLEEDSALSPGLKASIELLLVIVTLLVNRLGLNSSNSSKPPSTDLLQKKKLKKEKDKNDTKPGGQKGHKGKTLRPILDPDVITPIPIDKSSLPPGQYHEVECVVRQVIDINFHRVVTEYQAQVLEDEHGKRFIAPFPEGVTRPVQYGSEVKVNAVYMSMFQLIPYDRVRDHFWDQVGLSLSAATVLEFNRQAYQKLGYFEGWVTRKILSSSVINLDETGINHNGTPRWLHCACTPWFTFFYPHKKRGQLAMDDMGILPGFRGTICHDHWKPYYRYKNVQHVLCNAHHLRELERAWTQDKQMWAEKMQKLLRQMNSATLAAGGRLEPPDQEKYRKQYRKLIADAEIECPPPEPGDRKGKRGRIPRSKARNLLERLMNFEDDVLRFMTDEDIPFTNNQAERDLRMTKLHQKISGCFRSWEGAQIFCRIRSYLSTSRKHGVAATEALRLLFDDKLPDFVNNSPE
jgi:transposase